MILAFSVFLILGLLSESIALFLMLGTHWPVLAVLLVHLIASLSIVAALNQFKPLYDQYDTRIRLLYFLIVFFIPLLGIGGALLFARWLYLAQRAFLRQNIYHLDIDASLEKLNKKYSVGGLRIHLQTKEVGLDHRIEALKVASGLPQEKINHLIRSMLPEEQDELRLLAFHLLSKQEKKLIPDINRALNLLKTVKTADKKARLERFLANKYWELIYLGLIEPGIRIFILKQTLYYTEQALTHFDKDYTLWFLLGRIHLQLNHPDLAIEAFQKTIALGAFEISVIPYLIEAHFKKREYAEIRALIPKLSTIVTMDITKAMVKFWSVAHA